MSERDLMLKTPAILTGVRPLKDGGLNLAFATQEVTRPFMVEAMELYQSFGHLLFKPNEVQMNEVPEDDATPSTSVQSPSLKLKNTVYALYAKRGKPYGVTGFDKFWREYVEKLRTIPLKELEETE